MCLQFAIQSLSDYHKNEIFRGNPSWFCYPESCQWHPLFWSTSGACLVQCHVSIIRLCVTRYGSKTWICGGSTGILSTMTQWGNGRKHSTTNDLNNAETYAIHQRIYKVFLLNFFHFSYLVKMAKCDLLVGRGQCTDNLVCWDVTGFIWNLQVNILTRRIY